MTSSNVSSKKDERRRSVGEVRKRKSTREEEESDAAEAEGIQPKRVRNDEDGVLKVRTRNTKSNSLVVAVLGGTILRILCYMFIYEYLSRQPQLTTPFVSFKRLQSGVAMLKDGISPYEGDTVLIQPIILQLFSFVLSAPRWVLLTAYVFLDLLTAASLRDAVQVIFKELNYADPDDYAAMAFKFYFLNPLSICTCSVLSLSVIYNSLLSLFVYAFSKSALVASSALLGCLAYFQLYPLVLIISMFIRFKSLKKAAVLLSVILLTVVSLFFINYVLNGFSTSFIRNCYGMLVFLEDLTPNVGMYWYFFTQIFAQMRNFYLCVFQLTLPTVCLCLALALRDNAHFHLLVSLILIAVFSSYPTHADAFVYMSLLPIISDISVYERRFLLLLCTLVTTIVFLPITWHMWMVSGSGNANYYFAVALFYNLAQIFGAVDIVYMTGLRDVHLAMDATRQKEIDLKTLAVY